MDPWDLLHPRYTLHSDAVLGGEGRHRHGNSLVRRYTDNATGETVVIKLIAPVFADCFEHSKRVLREVALLRQLSGRGEVVRLRNVLATERPGPGANPTFLLVFQSLAMDLDSLFNPKQGETVHAVSVHHFKALLWQLLRGVAVMNRAGTVHRDLKLANLGTLDATQTVILDLGLARVGLGAGAPPQPPAGEAAAAAAAGGGPGAPLGAPPPAAAGVPLTGVVSSPNFRAPEVPLWDGLGTYTSAIDVWSSGVILTEMLRHLSNRLRGPGEAPSTTLFPMPSDPAPDHVFILPDTPEGLSRLYGAVSYDQWGGVLGNGASDLRAALQLFVQESAASPGAPAVLPLAVDAGGTLAIEGELAYRKWVQGGVWGAYRRLRASAQRQQRLAQLTAIARVVGAPETDERGGLPPPPPGGALAQESAGLQHARGLLLALRQQQGPAPLPPWDGRQMQRRLQAALPYFGRAGGLFPCTPLASPLPAAPLEGDLLCDLASSLLTFNPQQRISAEAALRHPFFQAGAHKVYNGAEFASMQGVAPLDFEEPTPESV